MRTRVRGWRWRRNPLRRRSDVVEAWTVLAVALLLLLVAPLAGAVVGWWAHDDARATAAEQRAERHRVRAEVTGRVPDSPPAVQGGRERSYRVTVRWTEAAWGHEDGHRAGPGRYRPGRQGRRVVRLPGARRGPAARRDRRLAAHPDDGRLRGGRCDRGDFAGPLPRTSRRQPPPARRVGTRLGPHRTPVDPPPSLTAPTAVTRPLSTAGRPPASSRSPSTTGGPASLTSRSHAVDMAAR